MESCYRVYDWLTRTLAFLMLEFFWKMQQISDYFDGRKSQPQLTEDQDELGTLKPLTKEMKFRRHIRSMSDVRSGTPHHMIPVKSLRRGSQQLVYDSDSRTRKLRLKHRYRYASSSDSSDGSLPNKNDMDLMEQRVIKSCLKVSDSMRYL